METNKFNLADYVPQIKKVAAANSCNMSTAVQYFVTNLIIMREHYEGAPELNYHQLGQQWNGLLSKDKVRQQTEVERTLLNMPKSGGNF